MILGKDNYKRRLLLLAVLLLALVVRLPFLPENISFNNDTSIYSRNIDREYLSGDYDVQAPGYFSYIGLGRLLNPLTDDSVVTQHLINIVLVLLIVTAIFYLLLLLKLPLHDCFWGTAMISMSNVFLLGSITGGNRMFLLLCSIILLYLGVRIYIYNERKFILYFTVSFAFLIGFRQDLSIDFMLLYFFLLHFIKSWRYVLYSLLIFSCICLSWFIPLLAAYGGPRGYINFVHSADAVYNTSIFLNPSSLSPYLNMTRIFVYVFNICLLFLPLFLYSVYKNKLYLSKRLLILLIFTFIPAWLFQMLVHNGNFVQSSSFILPLYIVLIYNYRSDSRRKTVFPILLLCLMFVQFYFVKMSTSDNKYLKLFNVVWLQYTYDGVLSANTLNLRSIEEDFFK